MEPYENNANQVPVYYNPERHTKRNVIIWVVGIAVAFVIFLFAKNVNDTNSYIDTVKFSSPNGYTTSYGVAFSKYFDNEKWEYFVADTGEDIVQFTGVVDVGIGPEKVLMQFMVTDMNDVTADIELLYLDVNGVAQNNFVIYALINDIFTYAETGQSNTKSDNML